MLYPELQELKDRERRSLRGRALRIALAYALFAALWIWGSDALLALLVDDPAHLMRISSYKGIAFVAVTAGLLWALTRATYARIESGYLEAQDKDRQLRASEHRHRDLLDRILEGCQVIGRDWRYLYLNPAIEAHNRRPSAELIGKRMQEVWPGIEATRPFALMQRCMLEREPFQEVVEFVFPDGEHGWFELNGYPVPEGIAVFSIEISARKQAEAAVLRANRELEATVAERTAQLQAALARAEAADKLKSAFLATMSHELRTPLNSIIGFTGIVLQRLAGPVSEEQQRQLTMVMGSARHLLELINDVLDLSKIEA
ncbi:MAG: PAS domain-containing protein, partial [Xanthomonadales bacterium]|nr:PAS domain-containing protein [Xanthomonadales bacterium]